MPGVSAELSLKGNFNTFVRAAAAGARGLSRRLQETSSATTRFSNRIDRVTSRTNRLTKTITGATASVLGFNRASNSSSLSLSRMVGPLASAAAGYLTLSRGVKFAQTSLEEFQRRYVAQARLLTLYQKRFGSNDISGFTNFVGNNRGIASSTQQLESAAQIAPFVTNEAQLRRLTETALNVTAGKHGINATTNDYSTIARAVGKAYQGETFALQRLVGLLPKATRERLQNGTAAEREAIVTTMLSEAYGDMNRTLANTPFGRIRMFRNSMEDLRVEVGRYLLPAISEVYDFLNRNFQTISAVATGVSKRVQIAIRGIISSFNFLRNNTDLTTTAFTIFTNSVKIAIATVVGFRLAMIATAATFKIISLAVAGITALITGLTTTIFSVLLAFVAFPPILIGIVGAIGLVSTVLGNLQKRFGEFTQWGEGDFIDLADTIADTGISTYNSFAGMVNSFLNFTSKVTGAVMQMLNKFLSHASDIATIFQSIWNGVIGAIGLSLQAFGQGIRGVGLIAKSPLVAQALGFEDGVKLGDQRTITQAEARADRQRILNDLFSGYTNRQRDEFRLSDDLQRIEYAGSAGPGSWGWSSIQNRLKEVNEQYNAYLTQGSYSGRRSPVGYTQSVGADGQYYARPILGTQLAGDRAFEVFDSTADSFMNIGKNVGDTRIDDAIRDRIAKTIEGSNQWLESHQEQILNNRLPLIEGRDQYTLKQYARRLGQGVFRLREGTAAQALNPEDDESLKLQQDLLSQAIEIGRNSGKTSQNTDKMARDMQRFYDLEDELATIRATNNYTTQLPSFPFTFNVSNGDKKETIRTMVRKVKNAFEGDMSTPAPQQ